MPRLYDYAENYYLPIVRTVRRVKKSFKELPLGPIAGDEGEFHLCLYHFLDFFRRFQNLREKKAGVFFQNRNGESLVAQAWRVLDYHVEMSFGGETRDRMLELMIDLNSFHAFRRKLVEEPVLQRCGVALADWINEMHSPPGSA